MEKETVSHPFLPIFDNESKILILGSFPSVKSRETNFFYGHPRNRFWPLIARLCQSEIPMTIEEKTNLLLTNHIAIWDVIASCKIKGSSDSSIEQVIPNDLSIILDHADIKQVYANGGTACRFYKKYTINQTGKEIIQLPSTSPANAAWSKDKLFESWKQILEVL
ncbi:G:T/U mismatch-specific uracil/thymine DNA-glycosylase [Lachnospiraceae bacterium TWA4]|nr:G:T/U mismatch-specific uracil/thymine DNA-glycosylase [Lachnospiraceae bacterium TWA4]